MSFVPEVALSVERYQRRVVGSAISVPVLLTVADKVMHFRGSYGCYVLAIMLVTMRSGMVDRRLSSSGYYFFYNAIHLLIKNK